MSDFQHLHNLLFPSDKSKDAKRGAREILIRYGILPVADCANCEHMKNNQDGGHCYMFKESPGTHCGQMTQAKDDQP